MSTEKTNVQKTLIEMRRRLNLTQQQLAAALKVAAPTVGRWESTRSPTGSSLAQLAAFAENAGDKESARIFREAATIPANPVIYVDLQAAEAHLRAQAAARALEQIRTAARRNRAVHREYVRVLRALSRALSVLGCQALEGLLGKSDFYADMGFISEAQRNLQTELNEQEGKQTKER